MLAKIISLYELILFIRIILSWIPHNREHPAAEFLHKITDPVLEPLRRIIPPIGGMDVSPIIVFLILEFVRKALV